MGFYEDYDNEFNKIKVNKNKYFKIAIVTMLLIVFFIGGLFTGMITGRRVSEEEYAILSQYELLSQVMSFVDEKYYTDVDYEEMVLSACMGVVGRLDAYSGIITEEGAVVSYESPALGISISNTVPGLFRIEWVNSGSPAYQAGIQIGEYIHSVNGQIVEGNYIATLNILFSNKPVDTQFELGIYDKDRVIIRNLTITTALVSTEFVRYIGDFTSFDTDGVVPNDMGYIKLSQFTGNAAEQFATAIDKFIIDEKKFLILDLRGNGGGNGSILEDIASYLITDENNSDNIPIISLDNADGTKLLHKTKENKYIFKNIEPSDRPKIVVLTNGGTASASEALIGSMIVSGTCELIGTKTYGKGIGQITYDIPSTINKIFSIKLTTGYFYFTDDVSNYIAGVNTLTKNIQGKGFTPQGVDGEYNIIGNNSNILTQDNQFLAAVQYFEDFLK